MGWYEYRPYVSAAQRRAQAAREVAKRLKKGLSIRPVSIEGRLIARTFWGKAWCENLEGSSDFSNRLPRGRTYVRNGSVIHLDIQKGRIDAIVSGSELYDVTIEIVRLPANQWQTVKQKTAGMIGSLVELLQGKLSKAVMEQVTDRKAGLFPKPAEISMRCSCPDYAGMCKHIAAVLYGVGNRLDSEPQLLFLLRGVDHLELISQPLSAPLPSSKRSGRSLSTDELGAIFDIEIGDDSAPMPLAEPSSPPKRAVTRKPKTAASASASTKSAKTKTAKSPPPSTANTVKPKPTASTRKSATSTKSPKATTTKSPPAMRAKTTNAKPAVKTAHASAKPAKPAAQKPTTKPKAVRKKKSTGE